MDAVRGIIISEDTRDRISPHIPLIARENGMNNEQRTKMMAALCAPFDPATGEGFIGETVWETGLDNILKDSEGSGDEDDDVAMTAEVAKDDMCLAMHEIQGLEIALGVEQLFWKYGLPENLHSDGMPGTTFTIKPGGGTIAGSKMGEDVLLDADAVRRRVFRALEILRTLDPGLMDDLSSIALYAESVKHRKELEGVEAAEKKAWRDLSERAAANGETIQELWKREQAEQIARLQNDEALRI